MTEDFIYEEETDGGSSPNRRPFLTAVGILLTIFVLAVICSATLLLTRDNSSRNGDTEQIAAIETQNAVIAVTNAAVTQTIAAMETEAARPTNTPQPPPTNTPRPTNTPLPTNTPVVQQAEEEPTTTATVDLLGTSTFSSGSGDSTPTPIAALSGGNGSGTNDSLPQTGIETWGILIAAFGLIAALVAARRLRSS
ncbi:MAG: LPXTG cell wall anchor domain-containing protein [Anaerolineales bacterium]|nr:LPXTG cell wall anchor domain-containing protein [Anaerolineales bacterium]